ncbi:MAG TPA: GNAT family N-acetyltransferase [Gemmatirosa sp.]
MATTPALPAGVAIRPATADDVPLIRALVRELAEYERALDECRATEEALRASLFPPPASGEPAQAEVVIAEVDGAPQGFALWFHNYSTWEARRGLYLEDLFVRPAARGRGVGRALLTHLARVAVARGCGRFEWSVLDWNAPAIGFYEALGARMMTEWRIMRVDGEALPRLAGDA